jgi:hypothetical protein
MQGRFPVNSVFALLLSVTVLGIAAVPVSAQRRGPRGGEEDAARYGWTFNLEAAKKSARHTGKPIMVVLRCVP